MFQRPLNNNLLWLISPGGLILLSSIPFVFGLSIGQVAYETYVQEPYLMFSSLRMPVFYAACTLCIWLGTRLAAIASVRQLHMQSAASPLCDANTAFISVCFGLLFFTSLDLYSFILISRNTTGLIGLLLSGGGDVAKEAINTEGAFSQAQPLLIAFNGYAQFRYLQFRSEFSVSQRRLVLVMLLGSIALTLMVAVAKVARYEVLPIVLSMIIVGAYFRSLSSPISNAKLLLYLGASCIGALSIFVLFSMFRGFSDLDALITSVMGYGAASYNHLAALIDGQLTLQYAGSGVYAIPAISFVPLFENIFHIREFVGMPRVEDAFVAEFLDARAAGLNGEFIWLTFFGYLYADFGLAALLVLIAFGFGFGCAWTSFFNRGASGLVWYIYMAQSAILFFSANYFARPALIVVFVLSLVLFRVERYIYFVISD